MTETASISWSRLMRWRTECWQKFGSVHDMPVISPHQALPGLLHPGSRVLDVGAGAHKPFKAAVTRVTEAYSCLDADPDGIFDFRSFDEIPRDLYFDLAIANQVLEHLHVDEAFSMVRSVYDRLVSGGTFLATVPNAAHPVRQWDCTHVTPWPVNDLYSLLRSAGFEIVKMSRYNKTPLTRNPLAGWVVRTVCREFRVDWCDSIMAVAVRESGDE